MTPEIVPFLPTASVGDANIRTDPRMMFLGSRGRREADTYNVAVAIS